jgi:predicted dienelactone hydrolase
VDTSRQEIYTTDTSDHRDLLVQVWYPAEKVDGAQLQPYWPNAYGPFVAAVFNMPGFLFDHVSLIQTHSFSDAPVAEAQPVYPVLFFSHAYMGLVNQNTVQMEELASHGYVVFSIAHPYEAGVVVYPDGRAVPMSPVQLEAFPPEGDEESVSFWNQCMAATDTSAREDCWRRYIASNPAARDSLGIWTQDTIFILDEIERINRGERPSLLAGRLDLERIGIFGHSHGGATAGEACLLDSRIKAGVNLDGFQWGDLLDHGIDQPFMIMYSELSNNIGANGIGMNDFMYDRVENQAYRLLIKGTAHGNFEDLSLFSPLFKIMGMTGPIDGRRMETILNRYLLAFFDRHLRGMDVPLLNGPDPDYPEVDFQRRGP